MLADMLAKERVIRAFERYKVAVQYLGYRLLSDEFVRSVAANIHKAKLRHSGGQAIIHLGRSQGARKINLNR
jgi:hypothetical protein